MDDRTANFLNNWIDSNIVHASDPPGDADAMQRQFLVDAVAAGLTLDDVNADWEAVERSIADALAARPAAHASA